MARDALRPEHVAQGGVDLVASIGGDGTCLTAAHAVLPGFAVPVLGINSDPS